MLNLRDLRFRFDVIRRAERRAALIIGASRAVMALVAFILLYFLFDRFFAPPLLGRWSATLAGLALVAWLFLTGVYRKARETCSDDEISMRIEELHPELNGGLLSFVQLARTRDQGRLRASPVLMQALEEETLTAVAPLNFLEIVPRDLARISLLAACFAIAVQVACLILLPWHFVALGVRLFDPDHGFPTRTRIAEVRAPDVVACGEEIPVTVELERGSLIPDHPGQLVFLNCEDRTRTEVDLVASTDNPLVYTGALPQTVDSVEVLVKLGDARSASLTVRVVPRPEVKRGSVRYHWPAYLKREDTPLKPLGALDVLQGGTLDLDLETTEPLADALLIERFGDTWPLTPSDEGGRHWRLHESFRVTHHTSFHIWMRDTHGITNTQPAVEYPLIARVDQPPEIVLQYPSRDLSVTPRARMLLRFDVRDDYGLRAVWLVYRVERNGQPQGTLQRLPLENLVTDSAHSMLSEQQLTWNLSRQAFQPGDQVVFWLEADDDCPTNDLPPAKPDGGEPLVQGPVYPKSTEIRLTIVSAQEKTLELQTRISRLYEDLNGLKDDQDDLRARVRELLRRLGAMQEKGD